MAGITASVSGASQIKASVGESKIDVSVGGGVGPTGSSGAAATIAVGAVTTGSPGSQATVTNVGTSSAAVLDFSIPAGAAGSAGAKGDKGDTGSAGAAGAAATISVGTVTTGSPGSSASVTNVGSSSSAVFNFTVPAGATGPQGPAGPQGETGPAGTTTWAGITDKPSEFAPSAHAASHSLNGDDELEIEGDQVRIAVDSENASTLGQGTVAATFLHTANATGLPTALPIATANARGAVRIGSGVSIDGNGVISVSTNYAAASHAHGSITSAGAIGTTSGLVLKTGTSGVIEALAQGTAGQVLVVNSGATAMEWKTLAAADVGAAAVSHAHSATNDLTFAGATAGQVLSVNGSGTALVWATPATYTLPQATNSTLGGITVSTGLSVASGALSVSYGTSSGTACQGNDGRLDPIHPFLLAGM